MQLGVVSALLAILTGLAVDRWLGEPPVRWHPVVWMGHLLGWTGKRLQAVAMPNPLSVDYKVFWCAALIWCAAAASIFIVSWGLEQALKVFPWWLAAVLTGILLKPLFAWTMLHREVESVEAALQESLDVGRKRLGCLVSRDAAHLSAVQVRESAIESLAENLNDSVIAPLFWFALLGLPGAAVFRFANTADAMWGYPGLYKGNNWAWAGKWAARVDDGLAWIPARLTAVLLWLEVRCAFSLADLRAEAAKTPSPNSGWPMAAMALGLNVCLAKPGGLGGYVLHAGGRTADSGDVPRALHIASNSVLAIVWTALAAIFCIAIGVFA